MASAFTAFFAGGCALEGDVVGPVVAGDESVGAVVLAVGVTIEANSAHFALISAQTSRTDTFAVRRGASDGGGVVEAADLWVCAGVGAVGVLGVAIGAAVAVAAVEVGETVALAVAVCPCHLVGVAVAGNVDVRANVDAGRVDSVSVCAVLAAIPCVLFGASALTFSQVSRRSNANGGGVLKTAHGGVGARVGAVGEVGEPIEALIAAITAVLGGTLAHARRLRNDTRASSSTGDFLPGAVVGAVWPAAGVASLAALALHALDTRVAVALAVWEGAVDADRGAVAGDVDAVASRGAVWVAIVALGAALTAGSVVPAKASADTRQLSVRTQGGAGIDRNGGGPRIAGGDAAGAVVVAEGVVVEALSALVAESSSESSGTFANTAGSVCDVRGNIGRMPVARNVDVGAIVGAGGISCVAVGALVAELVGVAFMAAAVAACGVGKGCNRVCVPAATDAHGATFICTVRITMEPGCTVFAASAIETSLAITLAVVVRGQRRVGGDVVGVARAGDVDARALVATRGIRTETGEALTAPGAGEVGVAGAVAGAWRREEANGVGVSTAGQRGGEAFVGAVGVAVKAVIARVATFTSVASEAMAKTFRGVVRISFNAAGVAVAADGDGGARIAAAGHFIPSFAAVAVVVDGEESCGTGGAIGKGEAFLADVAAGTCVVSLTVAAAVSV